MTSLILTLTGLACGVALAVFANWRAGRPRDDLKPKMLPWTFIMILAAFWSLLMVVHLINLGGVETGPEHSPFGRMR